MTRDEQAHAKRKAGSDTTPTDPFDEFFRRHLVNYAVERVRRRWLVEKSTIQRCLAGIADGSVQSNSDLKTISRIRDAAPDVADLERVFDELLDEITSEVRTFFEQTLAPALSALMDMLLRAEILAKPKLEWAPIAAVDVEDMISDFKRKLKKLLRVRNRGDHTGSGFFRNAEEFETALAEVLCNQRPTISKRKTLQLLVKHKNCQMSQTEKARYKDPTKCHPRTLDHWLARANLTWKSAKEKYCGKQIHPNFCALLRR